MFLRDLWKDLFNSSDADRQALSSSAEPSGAAEQWNRENVGWYRVPLDVRMLVLGQCDAQTLLSLRLVCRLMLRDLRASSPFWTLWQRAALRSGQWTCFCNARPKNGSGKSTAQSLVSTMFASAGGNSSDVPQEAVAFVTAIVNSRENARKTSPSPDSKQGMSNFNGVWSIHKPEGVFARLMGASDSMVPIFGNALETSARRLVYRLMWGNDTTPPLFAVNEVFPGTSGMGGGVSFRIRGKVVRIAPFYSWNNKLEITPALAASVSKCTGLTFVVDDALLENEKEMSLVHDMIQGIVKIAPSDVPVLVFNFAESAHLKSPDSVLELLSSLPKDRVMCVRNVPESTDSGVAEGFEWLTDAMP